MSHTYSFAAATLLRPEQHAIWLFQRQSAETLVLDLAGAHLLQCLLQGTVLPWHQRWSAWLLRHYLLGRGFIQVGYPKPALGRLAEAMAQAQHLIPPLRSLFVPEALHISITSACNQRCAGCFFSAAKKSSPQVMSWELFQGIIQTAAQHRVFQVALGGGEPLSHPQIVAMVQLATAQGLVANLTTNGHYLTATMAQQLHRAGLGQLQLSLNGADHQTHGQTRPHFAVVRDAMRVCQQAGLRWGLNVLITHQNVGQLDEILQLAQQENAYSVNLLRPKPAQDDPHWLNQVSPQVADITVVAKLLRKWQSRSRFLLTLDASWSFLMATQHWDIPDLPVMGCSAGRRILAIQPDGLVSPCGHFKGNYIQNGDFMAAWRDDPLFEDFRQLEDTLQGACQTCSWKSVCRGCRAVVMAQTGIFAGADVACPKQHSTLS